MRFFKRHIKRVGVDAAGYLLIVAAILTGWLPGPGGIPLALAGLGLLSIHNKWAHDLRQWLLQHGGKLVKLLFPDNLFVQWLYDILVILLLTVVGVLTARHDHVWQISVAVALFFLSSLLALTNRDRLKRLRGKA